MSKPLTNRSVSQSITSETKNQAIPSVMTAKGSVTSLRIGFRIVFNTPNTSAATKSVPAEPFTFTPPSTSAVTPSVIAFAIQETNSQRSIARSSRRSAGCASCCWDDTSPAPGGADEDSSGGFAHGGWHMRYMEDDLARRLVVESIVEAGGFLLGRRTYEIFAAYWPNAPDEEQVVAEPLNTKPKHVVSRTLSEPLEWQNSTLVEGDVVAAVVSLK